MWSFLEFQRISTLEIHSKPYQIKDNGKYLQWAINATEEKLSTDYYSYFKCIDDNKLRFDTIIQTKKKEENFEKDVFKILYRKLISL